MSTETPDRRVQILEGHVERLREAMAYEARVIEAQTLDLKSLSKGRRKILATQVERMRAVALGADWWPSSGRTSNELDALRHRVGSGENQ